MASLPSTVQDSSTRQRSTSTSPTPPARATFSTPPLSTLFCKNGRPSVNSNSLVAQLPSIAQPSVPATASVPSKKSNASSPPARIIPLSTILLSRKRELRHDSHLQTSLPYSCLRSNSLFAGPPRPPDRDNHRRSPCKRRPIHVRSGNHGHDHSHCRHAQATTNPRRRLRQRKQALHALWGSRRPHRRSQSMARRRPRTWQSRLLTSFFQQGWS